MEKNKWISEKIRKLINEGRNQDQAIAIAYSMYNSKQEGGYANPSKAFIEKSAAQLPIRNINYNVETTGIKEGNLQPGYYTRVDYNSGKSDYLRPEGLAELQRMNNYRLYMEAQAKKQQPQIQMGETIAMPTYQYGGYSFPNIMNNYQPDQYFSQPFNETPPDLSGSLTPAGTNFKPATFDAPTPTEISTNLQQKQDAIARKPQQYNDINRIQLANPYGGVSLENALYFGARGFGEGNVGQGILGSLTAGLKAARVGMSGYASGKEQNRVQDYMRNQLYKQNTNYQQGQVGQNATYVFQEGGKTPTNADMLTGAFITDQPNPNVKIEDAEYVKNSQTGQIQKAVGDKHEAKSGGIPVNLPPQSKILSDYTKIGAKNAKELKDKYDIILKASDTFAKAMDKVNKKIGITKLIEEEKEYSEKFEKQMKSSIDKKTKDVNLNFLSKELESIEKEKGQLKTVQDQAFEEIFKLQEAIPKRGDGKTLLKQEGGYAPNVIEYSKKYGITPQRVMELMQEGGEAKDEKVEGENESAEAESTKLEQIEGQVEEALKQGADPNQLLQQLVQMGVSQEQATQMIQELMQEIQSGETQSEMKYGGRVKMQEGGQVDPNQIIQAFAQLTQQDPQQIIAQLQQMKPEEQQQVLQQMTAALQQGSQNPQEEVAEGPMSNQQEDLVEGKMREGGTYLPFAQEGIMPEPYTFSTKLIPNLQGFDTTGISVVNKDNLTGVEYMQPYTGKGYGAQMANVEDTMKAHSWYFDTDKKKETFRKAVVKPGSQPEVKAFQEAYNKEIEARGKKAGLAQDQIDKIKEQVGFQEKGVQKFDGLFGAFTSTRPLYNFSKKDGNIQIEPTKSSTSLVQNQPQVKNRMVDKTMMANLPVNFNLPPSSLQGVYKPEVNLSRMEPYKLSTEPYLANIESQRQAATENNYNLPDVQRAAYNANMLAASQMAANDAIGKVTQANTAAQSQADMYNAQQADKEQLTNLGLAQQYENKMYGAINATDTDLRKYFAQNNAENRQRFMDIANLNEINAVTPNYQSTGSDIVFNNAPVNRGVPQVDPRIMKAFEDTKNDPKARAQVMKLLNLS